MKMFHLSLRELLMLTVIVALVFGWWIDRSSLADQNAYYKQFRLWKLRAETLKDSYEDRNYVTVTWLDDEVAPQGRGNYTSVFGATPR